MADSLSEVQDRGEFWRPPLETRREAGPAVQAESCTRCGAEFVAGSRFCHTCGAERRDPPTGHALRWGSFLNIHRVQDRLGMSLAALMLFTIGVICALAAIGTGLIYTANTVLDWQAVQIWRIEWLLAAIAALLAGILLKTADSTKRE
jgi:hypothetical protein